MHTNAWGKFFALQNNITSSSEKFSALLSDIQKTGEHRYIADAMYSFELDYFIGRLGRKSGCVIVLEKDEVEIPSDLSGILCIMIDNGIKAAGEDIRRAIEAAL